MHGTSLKPYNTFGLDVDASQLVLLESVDDLKELHAEAAFDGKHLVIGGGSNLLLTGNVEGLVLVNRLKGMAQQASSQDHKIVRFAGGEAWHDCVMWCIDEGLGGVENLSLIPGTVGAAPMQNIGAYGVEVKDVFVQLEAFNKKTGVIEVFDKERCAFGYRESVFKNLLKDQYIITSVDLQLTREQHAINTSYGAIQKVLEERGIEQPSLREVSDAVIAIRRAKLPDPKQIGNSGSFFKNPVVPNEQAESLLAEHPTLPNYPATNGVKIAAGWLIEQCGWKGKRVGETGAHAQQALVLVNYGAAKGAEVWALAQEIQRSVQEKFGVLLQPEVNVI